MITKLVFTFQMTCLYWLLFAFTTFLAFTTFQTQAQPKLPVQMAALETGFHQVPDSIQTSVYWYWVSGNISKEGVIKDLEAMKKVGINRAFIANVTWGEKNAGPIKLFTAAWWEVLHTALKTAGKLGIEIGIFNCPGWSQSGGPWVKPEQSMRYLSSSETVINGPLLIHQKLEQPNPIFQDVKVIAYPAPKDYGTTSGELKLKLNSTPSLKDLGNLTDHQEETIIHLPAAKPFLLDLSTEKPGTARSLVIYTAHSPTRLEGEIQVKINQTYQTIKHFVIDRTNPNLKNGFLSYGPATISIPATTAKDFRLVFTDFTANSGIAEIKLSPVPLVEDYLEKTLAKMWPDGYVYWPAYQWQPQPVINDKAYVIDPGQVLDISEYMLADGTLAWQVPAGKWIIQRSGITPTQVHNAHAAPEGTGLETDKMSKTHIAAHFDAFLGEIKRRIPAQDRKTWKIVVGDSYETGSQNWSDQFITTFKSAYGYDPLPYLPVFQGKVVGSADHSDRFLWDLRRFIADKVASDYVGGLREISHKNGLTTWLENYGHYGFPGEFLQYGGQSDEVSGEFWNEGIKGNLENRAASSCAHIYGKTKVSAESFTTTDRYFMNYPATLKQRADRSFTEGINNTLLHVYIQQPEEDKMPGMNAYFGTEFNRKNTWFNDMDDFLSYIKRCNLLLQQGKYVADVAYFISEDAPKMTGIQEPALPHGYSFDYINGEVIKTRLTVKDGNLVLPDGMQYRILVLPKLETMRPELLIKLKELVSQGAVILGPKPSSSPSLQNLGKADLEIQQLTAELWGNINTSTIKVNHYGKGMVLDGMSLGDALKLINVIPDFKTTIADSALFIHRELKDGAIYFISNQKNEAIQLKPEFRISGKSPELWDATTGKVRDLPAYTQTANTTLVPLKLAPYESAFVIFRKSSPVQQNESLNYPKIIKSIPITSQWLVNFDPKLGGPVKPVVFKQLTDWAENKDEAIKYYSGAAYYQNSFELSKVKKGQHVLLDLGNVIAIAKVKLNGIAIGGVWTAPYKIDITKAVKPGKNELEIKVVNNWINRLTGDHQLPENKRITSTYYDCYDPAVKLQSSGLIGPVLLQIVR
ncbi:glycosyl hydrolase [Pedobacter cryoconitis]|uniref:Alpha-L-rhamnosidase-like protein n=1 Tax=Pedobacter cryoconitis TaxID=188932 RepID=A0A327SBF3_9SPHI|nr:glycosyl hydrolase [Pedobacter cryoconitis]RAJ26350.1 alpha-L-rhamnosidase-like protein [Pedobacter cryoconitis]